MTVDAAAYKIPAPPTVSSSALWWRRFRIRLASWEYWPVYVFNIPVIFIWIWQAARARDFFFFSLTNPGIPTGGFFGESKSAILSHIPDNFKPNTVLLPATLNLDELEPFFTASGLSFPVIVKPEVGERGWLIAKIESLDALRNYAENNRIDLILQTYVELPLELSIMVYAMPTGDESGITSICEKKFLQVTGDGTSTLGDLIVAQDRAVLQYEKLVGRFGDRWYEIIPEGETLILEHIGNHCRGTMFLNRNDRIDEDIKAQMVSLLRSMPDVYYGRFDMRVASWESLRKGQEIMILEFNGTGSDPAHIYQPGYSLFRAYRDMAFHWNLMYRIALQNRRKGHTPATFKKIVSAFIIYFRYKRTN